MPRIEFSIDRENYTAAVQAGLALGMSEGQLAKYLLIDALDREDMSAAVKKHDEVLRRRMERVVRNRRGIL